MYRGSLPFEEDTGCFMGKLYVYGSEGRVERFLLVVTDCDGGPPPWLLGSPTRARGGLSPIPAEFFLLVRSCYGIGSLLSNLSTLRMALFLGTDASYTLIYPIFSLLANWGGRLMPRIA